MNSLWSHFELDMIFVIATLDLRALSRYRLLSTVGSSLVYIQLRLIQLSRCWCRWLATATLLNFLTVPSSLFAVVPSSTSAKRSMITLQPPAMTWLRTWIIFAQNSILWTPICVTECTTSDICLSTMSNLCNVVFLTGCSRLNLILSVNWYIYKGSLLSCPSISHVPAAFDLD